MKKERVRFRLAPRLPFDQSNTGTLENICGKIVPTVVELSLLSMIAEVLSTVDIVKSPVRVLTYNGFLSPVMMN